MSFFSPSTPISDQNGYQLQDSPTIQPPEMYSPVKMQNFGDPEPDVLKKDSYLVETLQTYLLSTPYVLDTSRKEIVLSDSQYGYILRAKKYRTDKRGLLKLSRNHICSQLLLKEWEMRKFINSKHYTVNLIDLIREKDTVILVREDFNATILSRLFIDDEANRKKLNLQSFIPISTLIVETVQKVHEQERMLHLNLCPSSLYYNKDVEKIKVSEWGHSLKIPEKSQQVSGVQFAEAIDADFRAPEIVDSSSVVDERADIYSVGVMFFYLLFGSVKQLDDFRADCYFSPEAKNFPKSLLDLITSMTNIQRHKRPINMKAVREQLSSIQTFQYLIDSVLDQNTRPRNTPLQLQHPGSPDHHAQSSPLHSAQFSPQSNFIHTPSLKEKLLVAVSNRVQNMSTPLRTTEKQLEEFQAKNSALLQQIHQKDEALIEMKEDHTKQLEKKEEEIEFLKEENINVRLKRSLKSSFGSVNQVLTRSAIGPLIIDEEELEGMKVTVPEISSPQLKQKVVLELRKMAGEVLTTKRALELSERNVELLSQNLDEEDIKKKLIQTERELHSYRDFFETEMKGKASQSEIMNKLKQLDLNRQFKLREQQLEIEDLDKENVQLKKKIQEMESKHSSLTRKDFEYRDVMVSLEETHKELESKRHVINTMTKDLKETDELFRESQKEKKDLEKIISGLKIDLSKANHQLKAKQQENLDLHHKLALTNNEVLDQRSHLTELESMKAETLESQAQQKNTEQTLKRTKTRLLEQERMNETLKLHFRKDKEQLIQHYEQIRNNLEQKVTNALSGLRRDREQTRSMQTKMHLYSLELQKSFDDALGRVNDNIQFSEQEYKKKKTRIENKVKRLIERLRKQEEVNSQHNHLIVAATDKIQAYIEVEKKLMREKFDLQEQVAQLTESANSEMDQIERIQNEKSSLNDQISSLMETIDSLKRQLVEAKDASQQYQRQYDAVRKENIVLVEQNEEWTTTIDVLQTEKEMLSESDYRMKQSMAKMSKQLGLLQSEKEALEESVTELEELLAIEKDESSKLNVSSNDLESQLTDRNDKLDQIQKEKEHFQELSNRQAGELVSAKQQIQNLQTDLQDIQQQERNLKIEQDALKKKLLVTENEKMSFERQSKKEMEERQKLALELGKIKNQLETVTKERNAIQGTINYECKGRDEKIQHLKQQKKDLTAKVQSLEQDKINLSKDVLKMNLSMDGLREKYDKLHLDKASKDSDSEKMRIEHKEKMIDIQTKFKQAEEKNETLQQSIDQQKTNIETLNQTINNLKQEQTDFKERSQRDHDEVVQERDGLQEKHKKKVDELQQKLKQSQKKMEQLRLDMERDHRQEITQTIKTLHLQNVQKQKDAHRESEAMYREQQHELEQRYRQKLNQSHMKMQQMQQEIQRLRQEHDKLMKEYQEQKGTIHQLENFNGAQGIKQEALHKDLIKTKQEKQQVQDKLDELKKETEEAAQIHRKQMDKMKNDYETLMSQQSDLHESSQSQQSQEHLKSVDQMKAGHRQQLDHLSETMEAQEAEHQAKIEEIHQQYSKKIQALESTIESLNQEHQTTLTNHEGDSSQLQQEFESKLSLQHDSFQEKHDQQVLEHERILEEQYHMFEKEKSLHDREMILKDDQIQELEMKLQKVSNEKHMVQTTLDQERKYSKQIEGQLEQLKKNSREFVERLKQKQGSKKDFKERLKQSSGFGRFFGSSPNKISPSPSTPNKTDSQEGAATTGAAAAVVHQVKPREFEQIVDREELE